MTGVRHPGKPTTDGPGGVASNPGGIGMGPAEAKAVVNRLKRAQGQISGVIKMIEQDRPCAEIVTQMAAASKALDRAGYTVMARGLRQCVMDPASTPDDVQAMERLFLYLA